MTLHEQIKGGIKEAMMAKDTVRLGVLRGLSTACMNEALNLGKTAQDMLNDEETLVVIRRAAKQRKDSIEQFVNGGRPELAEDEKAELAVLETFLPTMMGRDEITKIAEAKKAELGITDKEKVGLLMNALMKDLKGKADGIVVKEIVDSLF